MVLRLNKVFNLRGPAVIAPMVLVAAATFTAPQSACADTEQTTRRDISYFAQHDPDGETTIDYSVLSGFLTDSVFDTGPSERRPYHAKRNGSTGTRIHRGHSSRYAYEGNRFMFSFMTLPSRQWLTEYRQDLEDVASNRVVFHRLTRDEQLAFWLNLHNVVAIERIAELYPIEDLERSRIQRIVFEEKAVTIAGVPLSLNDIRLDIVYRHWPDPKVMYGFYHGVIGGPSLQTQAFTAENTDRLLTAAAGEFVNSLRGVEEQRGRLHISRLYDEARAAFFSDWPQDVRRHLNAFAKPDVAGLIKKHQRFDADIYSFEIADLAGGVSTTTRFANLGENITQTDALRRLPPQARRFMEGVRQKKRRMGFEPPEGTVTIEDQPDAPKPDRDDSEDNTDQ